MNRSISVNNKLAVLVRLLMTITLVYPYAARAQQWQPGRAPLMTRWAKDVSPENALKEYPRPSMVRKEWQNLNGLWDYAIVPKGADMSAPQGKILVPYPVESALSGVMKPLLPGQLLYYKRTFDIPSAWRGKHILLHCDAVDFSTGVWINGIKAGVHQGGYDRFSFDITSSLKGTGFQEIVMVVEDSSNAGSQACGKQSLHPEGASYTPSSGIWQTVWLEPVPEKSIASIRITPDIDASMVSFDVAASGSTAGTKGKESVEIRILANGRAVKTLYGETGAHLHGRLDHPRLWWPDSPFLYEYTATLTSGGKPVDVVKGYFGMRKTSLGKDSAGITRLLLNNRFIFQRGPLDQGFWPDGLYTAPTDDALKYDLSFVKSIGFNMVRKHIKIEPERWYYWADRLGVMVWQDMPAGKLDNTDAREQWEKELQDHIAALYNHPSIVMWVLFNEGWGQYGNQRLITKLRSFDATRLINNASGWYDVRWGDVVDKHFYPGPGVPALEEKRAVVTGEFGGLGFITPDHMWNKGAWGYQSFQTTDSLADEYQRLWQRVYRLKDEKGLSAAVYTQVSDIEGEANGLLTYDREISKIDVKKMSAANSNTLSPLTYVVLLPDSRVHPQVWKYTGSKPPDDWMQPGFDDKQWKEGRGGFGTRYGKEDVIKTVWEQRDLWIRKEFEVKDVHWPLLSMYYGEDTDIYINGILACTPEGFHNCYGLYELNTAAKAAMHPGRNVIAVHCIQRNKGGEEYVDIGVLDEISIQTTR